nr:hypothetical protein [Tanacetum cinerariifolium]
MARFVCLEELTVAANSGLVVDVMLVYLKREMEMDIQFATHLTKSWQELVDRVNERHLFIRELEIFSRSLVAYKSVEFLRKVHSVTSDADGNGCVWDEDDGFVDVWCLGFSLCRDWEKVFITNDIMDEIYEKYKMLKARGEVIIINSDDDDEKTPVPPIVKKPTCILGLRAIEDNRDNGKNLVGTSGGRFANNGKRVRNTAKDRKCILALRAYMSCGC